MIVKTVQGDWLDMRVRLVEDDETVYLEEGEQLEFKTKIRTQSVVDDDETDGIKEIDIKTNQVDDEGKVVFQIDLNEIKACAGRYKFEINFLRADGKKICLSPEKNNSLEIFARG